MIYFLIRRLIELKAISQCDARILVRLLRIVSSMRQKQKEIENEKKLFKRPKYMHWRQGR